MNHEHTNSASSQQDCTHRDRSSSGARALLESAQSLAGGCPSFRYGGSQDGTLGLERENQVAKLASLHRYEGKKGEWMADGGEHVVYFSDDRSIVTKIALPGIFGYVVDEERLLDDRTFTMQTKLKHRPSLPSEYLLRWAVLDQVFGLSTRFEGVMLNEGKEPSLVISQPFIGSQESDNPTWEQLEEFFAAHGFNRVDDRHIADPRIKGAVWYRQRDGLLMSDAFPRNFRVDASGVVIPIDLIVNIVPPGSSKILPPAEKLFTFAE